MVGISATAGSASVVVAAVACCFCGSAFSSFPSKSSTAWRAASSAVFFNSFPSWRKNWGCAGMENKANANSTMIFLFLIAIILVIIHKSGCANTIAMRQHEYKNGKEANSSFAAPCQSIIFLLHVRKFPFVVDKFQVDTILFFRTVFKIERY